MVTNQSEEGTIAKSSSTIALLTGPRITVLKVQSGGVINWATVFVTFSMCRSIRQASRQRSALIYNESYRGAKNLTDTLDGDEKPAGSLTMIKCRDGQANHVTSAQGDVIRDRIE